MNLYEYQIHPIIFDSKRRLDGFSGQILNNHQKIWKGLDGNYYYKTSETLVGKAQSPQLIKKNYRLATRSLNPLSLLKLVQKSAKQEAILFKKPPQNPARRDIETTNLDFQEFLITRLLLFCKSAEFLNLPLEQDQVPKLKSKCDGTIYHHFKPKPILHFKFAPQVAPLVLNFLKNLDTYAQEYDIEESQDFYDSRFSDPTESRNAYLNQWQINTSHYRKENTVSQQNQIYNQGLAPG